MSGKFAWKFDVSSTAHGLFGALVPIWVEEAELEAVLPIPPSSLISRRQDVGTTFWLPLREPSHPPPLSLSPSTLLFLRRLRVLELTVPPHLGGSRTLRRLESDKAGVSHEQREQREHGAAGSSKRRGKRHSSNASNVSAEKPRVPSDKGSVSHERRKQRKQREQREYGAAESERRATWRAFRMSSTGSVSRRREQL